MDKQTKIAAAIEALDGASASVREAFELIRTYRGAGEEYFEQMGSANEGIDWASAQLSALLPPEEGA